MIRKLLKIRNVGRFENCAWRGGAQFESITLIYGENSRGKSTFCDILRSLQSGIPDTILGRKRLGAVGDSEIDIRLDSSNATFANGVWSATFADIAIFDTSYVHQNIFAGDRIDHDHKKNQYRVIIGEAGIRLAEKVDQLDADLRTATKAVDEKRSLAQGLFPKGTLLAAIAQLPIDDKIAEKIAAKEKEIQSATTAASRSSEIKAKALLEAISIPDIPHEFEAILDRKMAAVAEDAERTLKAHLVQHTLGATEEWVAQGHAFQKDDLCPYCAQSVVGVDLVAAYRAFFDQAYIAFKVQLLAMQRGLTGSFGQKNTNQLHKRAGENAALWEFWQQFGVTEGLPLPTITEDLEVLHDIEQTCGELLREKTRSLTEPVAISEAYTLAKARYDRLILTIKDYNERIQQLNERVAKFKVDQATLDVGKLRSDLLAMKLVEAKQTPEATAALQAITDAENHRSGLESAKKKAKDELDDYTATVLSKHDARINELLTMFGAGFRIGQTTRSYVGGKPSSTYNLLINGVEIPLGDDRTPASVPCFRNTLSAGDRSTLALAFFISQLERDPKLRDKIVIFDDPFTSQDRSRRTATLTLIAGLSKMTAQTVVLSHDPFFLRACWDNHRGAGNVGVFQFFRMGQATTVGEWDVEKETLPEYSKKHKILWDYCYQSKGSPLEVAQTIRPLLEEYLRLKLPRSFSDTEWLGDFIAKIRAAAPNDPLAAAQPILPKIEFINDYSKRFHHSSSLPAATAVTNESELLTYVTETLKLVGGF